LLGQKIIAPLKFLVLFDRRQIDFADAVHFLAQFLDLNLNYETLSALHLKAVAYFSTSGDAVYGLEANTHLASTANLTPELAEILKQGMPSIRAGETKELQAGLLKTPVGIIMVTRSPILDSERSKPSRGSFVFVMSVDQNLVDELSKQTKLDIGIYPPSLKSTQPEQVEVVDQDNIIGRTVVRGLDGNEVAVIQVTLKRYVHILGLSARKTLLLCLAVCSVVATLLASLLVYRVIVAALKSSVREIQEISLSGDASKRLSITGQDELGVLAQQINSMLETLARTQDELQKARDEAQAAHLFAAAAEQGMQQAIKAQTVFCHHKTINRDICLQ
jgi:sensor domain CHASE-containing protein